MLKALDTEAICILLAEAQRLRLSLGASESWMRAHLAGDGVHYLVPDPASYYWPGNSNGRGGRIEWWQCRLLLRMRDGTQVSSLVAVLPETFAALPSVLPRREQLRLFRQARATKRDGYLWGRDHLAECGPQTCGYEPRAAEAPSPDEYSAGPETTD
ncbi:hypothetical protein ACWEO1_34080 [Kitasatospora cineracea]